MLHSLKLSVIIIFVMAICHNMGKEGFQSNIIRLGLFGYNADVSVLTFVPR